MLQMREKEFRTPLDRRLGAVILVGHECAWNHDDEFRPFVINTLKASGYSLQDFGYDIISG